MTEFLQLNLPNYNLNENESKTTENDLCICCLKKNISLIQLINCKHVMLLEKLTELKVFIYIYYIIFYLKII